MSSYPNVRVVGMHFRGAHAKEIASALSEGDTLELRREPENQFDANAIMVWHPGTAQHIGYVEATQAVWIASELDDEANEVSCTVSHLHTERNNVYPIVNIEVT